MNRSRSDVLAILGLARRAGEASGGTEAVRQAVRDGRAKVVVMATDASPTQLKKIRSTIHNRTIPQVFLGDRSTLGAAIGAAPLAAIAVTDASLAGRLLEGVGSEEATDAPDEPERRR
ncbi:MAG: ribosomal L7Ae/L30e/S12e/Gadd45 family protein [Gemmatimonadota bacterium]|nr:ribosomal L7Ae/L30e/S12e/Gadd45 family protein [Gemmatimonadota bacterium]